MILFLESLISFNPYYRFGLQFYCLKFPKIQSQIILILNFLNMEISQLNLATDKITNDKTNKLYVQMQELIKKINEKKISPETISFINEKIDEVNATTFTDSQLYKQLKITQNSFIKKLEADHKIVTKNYYRNLWTAVGMSAFGLPFGLLFGLLMGNIALFAIGLPIGLAIGVGVGTSLDKKAFAEGRQIDIELKF